jgi:hypothetical protein
MKRSTIYLAMASTSYEGSTPIRAFKAKEDAVAFVEKCRAHHCKAPQPPYETVDTPENDELHEKWWDKLQRWRKRHPAGAGNRSCEFFEVWDVPMYQ